MLPLKPVKIAPQFDPAESSNDFTKGVFGATYGKDGYWYVYEKDGTDGQHGEVHQIKVVDGNECPDG